MKIWSSANKRTIILAIVLILAIIVTFVINVNLGVVSISPMNVIKTLLGRGSDNDSMVLFYFRLPRIVIAILIGIAMAISGAILQSITHNDLADPGIIGINAGAGFAVVLYIYLSRSTMPNLLSDSVYLMPLTALTGAIIAAILIYVISWKNGISPIRLVLVGIGINSAFAALIIMFQLKMDPTDFTRATVWLSGNISGTDWTYVLALLPWVIVLVPIALYQSSVLNTLQLGDDVAKGLGTRVESRRLSLLFIAVALAGASVAVGGGIAFIGLVTPHLAKKLVGANHQLFLPITGLMGALLLLVSDTIGRNILSPSEIPVGLVVSLIGGSYFIYLLMKS
ncbi:FecCD family ABC transporter permease [Aquibacillus salsiterrae]|uniref:Iron ABC transporter permease n=1 Tax=Aquibacillus salsiterrae TaxID=2950439 RepID=A0A9X4AEZ8_9BACI|nr:iron ABC transporter permease [Aquibacillus salsiterrae]MDC3417129.1 iron ABC transporter permease [Aquibacillus salsiterrae]